MAANLSGVLSSLQLVSVIVHPDASKIMSWTSGNHILGICLELPGIYPVYISMIYVAYTLYILAYTMYIHQTQSYHDAWYILGYTMYIHMVYAWYIHGYTWYII